MIPDDPLGRRWVEVSGANPERVEDYRPSLVAFLAFGPGRHAMFQGTGFVISANEDCALAITARHVLSEGVARFQRPHRLHEPSALPIFLTPTEPSIGPKDLRAIWMGDEDAGILNVVGVEYNTALDIALCTLVPQPAVPCKFRAVSIPIDTAVPKVGDAIHLVSHGEMDVTEFAEPASDGDGQGLLLGKALNIRVGTVTGVYPNGYRQYRWPCFTTSVPARKGMSGGFVSLLRQGQTIGACGIVCADNSTESAHVDYTETGESVVACSWPSLILRVPEGLALFEMMQRGHMPMALGGIEHIYFEKRGDGEWHLGLKPNSH